MAQLPTPTIQGAFTSASLVQGTTSWASQSNLEDLNQVRVRYARSTQSVAPSRADLSARPERTATSWATFSSGGRSYQYRDDRITSGFDNTPPSFTDRSVPFSEGNLSGFNVWAMSRLEV